MRFRDSDYEVYPNGQIINSLTDKVIQSHPDKNGYQKVTLFIDGNKQEFYVHRIVAECFVPKPVGMGRLCVKHIDYNKNNNSSSNLKWDTFSNIIKVCHKDNIYKDHLESLKKKIILFDPSTYMTVEFKSLLEAAIYLKSIRKDITDNVLSIRSNISSCLTGGNKLAYGYNWHYISDFKSK